MSSRDPENVVKKGTFTIAPGDERCRCFVRHPEVAGVTAVAATKAQGRPFDELNLHAAPSRGYRSAESCTAAAYDENIDVAREHVSPIGSP